RGVEVEVQPDLPAVDGDRMRLLEVWQNLISNAAKYMGEQPSPRIEIGCKPLGDEVCFYVRDNGVGIPPAYHEKVFELFERLGTDTEGTGVGLALVKRIVEFHGGRIWVESEGMGRGSTFYFTLPKSSPAPGA
ncbi:MAG: histidine kinase, partial [Bacteroidetes bacterium]